MRLRYIAIITLMIFLTSCATQLDSPESVQEAEVNVGELSNDELDIGLEELEDSEEEDGTALAGQAFKRLPKSIVNKVGKKLSVGQLQFLMVNEKIRRQKAESGAEFRDVTIEAIQKYPIVDLSMKLYRPGLGRERKMVEAYWIGHDEDGEPVRRLLAREEKLFSAGSGTANSMRVDVRGHDINRGSISVIIPECNYRWECQRIIFLNNGDLDLDLGDWETIGRERILSLNVVNKGILRSPECELDISVKRNEEFESVRQLHVPSLEPEEIHQFERNENFRYVANELGQKTFRGTLECDDLIPENNRMLGILIR